MEEVKTAIFRLPSGEHREMSLDEAARLDSPEGVVVVTVSATHYRELVEGYESMLMSK